VGTGGELAVGTAIGGELAVGAGTGDGTGCDVTGVGDEVGHGCMEAQPVPIQPQLLLLQVASAPITAH